MERDKLILKARRSWWNFFWHFLFFFLVIPLIIALWKRADLLFKVYSDRVVLERGVLSKEIKKLFISDIRTIDVKQSLIQRILGIGDVLIATAGTSGYEDIADGVKNPKSIQKRIMNQRQKLRDTTD